MEPAFIGRYRDRFERTWSDDTPIDRVRFVVLDSETTGLNPRTDRIITIGAVAVEDGEIVLEDSFSALLKVARNTEAVTVHGVTRDESLGGTSFYIPARPAEEIAALFSDSKSLDAQEFTRRHGIEPGYIHGSNHYFTCIGTVPAKWNRLIFYDGSVLHSGHIEAPEKLNLDPLQGRLTLNGFFTCRRNVA